MIKLETYQSGHHQNSLARHEYFVPNKINDNWSWNNPQINTLLEKAAIKIGELNTFASKLQNIDLFVQMFVTKEAVTSSRIDKNQTQIYEFLLQSERYTPERSKDWHEVKNYIAALNNAIRELSSRPMSSELIKSTHKTLLETGAGEQKKLGAFRDCQNWIGGNDFSDAEFIPPHHKLVDELMDDLVSFLNNENSNVPELIKIAIAHYQFETIHPFLEGNGRIGRLLIPLFLLDRKILTKPLLCLSSWFEKNKGHYYDNLTSVRTKNDITQWLVYFLTGIAETANKAQGTLLDILQLKDKAECIINDFFGRRACRANVLLKHLFENPVVNVREVQKIVNLSYKAANELVSILAEHGILKEATEQERNRLFRFEEYLRLF